MTTFERGVLINGRYRILRELGEGAMGSVHLVADTLDEDRLLALKTVRAEVMTPQSHQLFKSEFAALTQVHHPNVVEVYDFGTIRSTEDHFFTMEFIEGRSLLDACASATAAQVYHYTAQICRALEYIHSQGFTHFDLKPDNIMVSVNETVKVMDFGLVEEGSFFQARLLKGTVAYIAPEMIVGRQVDHRLDLYSLGAVLFHVVTGRLVFPGDTMVHILRRHLKEPPNFRDNLPRPIPEPLIPLLNKLLAKEPDDRYASAGEALADVERLLARETHESTRSAGAVYTLGSRLVGRRAELSRLKEAFRQRITESAQSSAPLLLITGGSGMGKSRLLQEFRHYVQLSGVRFLHGSCLQNGGQSFLPFAEILRALVREILGVEETLVPSFLPAVEAAAGASVRESVNVHTSSENSPRSLVNFAQTLGSDNMLPRKLAPEIRLRENDPNAPTVWTSDTSPPPDTPRPPTETALLDPADDPGHDWHELLRTHAAAVAKLVPEDYDLRALVGSAKSPAQAGREKEWLIASLSKLLCDLSRARPLVLYCSDLHWADDLTIELLTRLARDVARAIPEDGAPPRLVLCGCARHDEIAGSLLEKNAAELAAEGAADVVHLQPLESAHVLEMLHSMLGQVDLPERALSAIVLRTHGNPFSIETAIQDALESRILVRHGSSWMLSSDVLGAELAPATVAEALDRTIEKLSAGDTAVLRLLSVFNRPVSAPLLRAAALERGAELSPMLARLRKKHLVERGWSEGQYQYSLRHAKLRDHVYDGLAAEDRSRLHGSAGAAIERLYPGSERYLNDLARHFLHAGETEKAIHYTRAAADRAKRMFDLTRAAALFTQAYDLLSSEPDTAERRLLEADIAVAIAEVSYYTPSERNSERLQQALAVAEQAGDADRCARIQNWLGRTYYALGRQNDAIRCFHEFMRLTEGTDDDQTRALPYSVLGRVYVFLGRFEQAHDYLERAAALLRGQPGCEDDFSYVLGMYGSVCAYLGDFAKCRRSIEESIAIARSINHGMRVSQGQIYLGITLAVQGEWAASRSLFEQGLKIAREMGNTIGVGTGSSFLGLSYLAEGDAARAVELCRFGRDHIAAAGGTWTFSMIGSHLAEALLALGDVEAALAEAEETAAIIDAGERWGESSLYIALGRIHARRRDSGSARAWFERAIAVAEQQKSPPFVAKARLAGGAFFLATGDAEAGVEEVARSRDAFRWLGMPWYLARAESLLQGATDIGPCP